MREKRIKQKKGEIIRSLESSCQLLLIVFFFRVGNLRHKVSLPRMSKLTTKSSFYFVNSTCQLPVIESFRFKDEDEDEDEDEALSFRHNEIFKLFRLELGRDDEVDCNNIVTPSLTPI